MCSFVFHSFFETNPILNIKNREKQFKKKRETVVFRFVSIIQKEK